MLELIISIGIILVTTITAATLIIITITAGRVSQSRVEAANFAREGIEVIRDIRDSNWLKRQQNISDGATTYQWDDDNTSAGYVELGATPTPKYYTLTFSPSAGWSLVNSASLPSPVPAIMKDGTSYFHSQNVCAGCVATKFTRLVKITKVAEAPSGIDLGYYLNVESEVAWRDRSGPHTSTARTRLYNWK